jgi:hypothetical protein
VAKLKKGQSRSALASPERMLLADAYFHYRETGSRSDRQAIIDLSTAIRSGKLGEPIAEKMTELLPGGAKPHFAFNVPIPAEAIADRTGMSFDYELSRATWKVPSGSHFMFEGITFERDRVLAQRRPVRSPLQAHAPSMPSKGFKRGQKGYSESELKPFEVKFYLMLADDDVQPEQDISKSGYGEKLEDWGKRNCLKKVPSDNTLAEKITRVWWPAWLSVHGFNK